jgi:hypothetical protein
MSSLLDTSPLYKQASEAEADGDVKLALQFYDKAIASWQEKYDGIVVNSQEKRQLAQAIHFCSQKRCALFDGKCTKFPQQSMVITPRSLNSAVQAHSVAKETVSKAGGAQTLLGSAAVGAAAGLTVAGPLGCIAGAVGGAYLTTQSGPSGRKKDSLVLQLSP